jgi:ABC-type glycerol-3-phosphate transport system permease component
MIVETVGIILAIIAAAYAFSLYNKLEGGLRKSVFFILIAFPIFVISEILYYLKIELLGGISKVTALLAVLIGIFLYHRVISKIQKEMK